MQKRKPPLLSGMPPMEVRLKLQRAAKTPVPASDQLARTRAIDRVMEWARAAYPEFFR